jgi:hypothetical protein
MRTASDVLTDLRPGATGKQDLQVHAARLREIAAYACWVSPEYDEALLAGAEALENLEVAKAALEQIINNRIGDVGRCGSRHCDCSECVALAALARLEGK